MEEKIRERADKKEVGCVAVSRLVPRSTEGFSRETYRLKPLHCILADVHPPGLLYLHMSQVLQETQRERERVE